MLAKTIRTIFAITMISLTVSAQDKQDAHVETKTQQIIQVEILSVNGDLGLGGEYGWFKNKGFGWTASLKFKDSGTKDSGISYHKAKNIFNDKEKGSKYGVASLSAGTTYGFNDNFFISASIAYDSYTKYAEFYDEFQILGDQGNYSVVSDKSSQLGANIKAYYSLPNSQWCFSIGHQTGIVGTYIGVGWSQ